MNGNGIFSAAAGRGNATTPAEAMQGMNAKGLPGTVRAGDTLAAVQICPFGEWQGGERVQVCDRAAFEQVVAAWRAGGAKEVLMDFEHASEADRVDSDTRAAAWISNLAVDGERGLVGDLKFTDQGADAVANRRLRFLSPVWPLDADGRPARLKSVALTNRPNIPVAPVLNKRFPDGPENPAAPGNPETKETSEMDKLKELLGLAPEATDEDVAAAVAKLVRAKKDAEAAALEREADEFAQSNKAKLDPAVCKAQYIANKEACRAIVAAIPEAQDPPQVVLNKAKTPDAGTGGEAFDTCREQMAALPPAERAAFYREHRADIDAGR